MLASQKCINPFPSRSGEIIFAIAAAIMLPIQPVTRRAEKYRLVATHISSRKAMKDLAWYPGDMGFNF